jgi:hypothetical protein
MRLKLASRGRKRPLAASNVTKRAYQRTGCSLCASRRRESERPPLVRPSHRKINEAPEPVDAWQASFERMDGSARPGKANEQGRIVA